MAATVSVLCPNGYRLNVKVQPATRIIQILEEACAKYDFVPEEYDLIHHRRTLDPSLSFRLSGLPNNAKLEMVKRESAREEKEVTIGLQLADGERIQGTFLPKTTLLEILLKLLNKSESELVSPDENLHPVVVFVPDEILGLDALRSMTLKELGIADGRAILRYAQRQVDPAKLEEIRNALKNKKERIVQPIVQSIERQSSTSDTPVSPDVVPSFPTTSPEPMEADIIPSFPTMTRSIFTDPAPPRAKPPRQQQQQQRRLMEEDALLSMEPPAQPSFENFKFPEETKGQDLYRNELNEDNGDDDDANQEVDRQPSIYSLRHVEERPSSAEAADVTDEFFELTVDDLRHLLRDLKRTSDGEEQLMTKSMRDAAERRSMKRYPFVVIRVVFANQMVLQGFFRPSEPVSALYAFVESHITASTRDWYLYTSPPKQVLQRNDDSLYRAQLCPAALVYFGAAELDKSSAFLLPELCEGAITPQQAAQLVENRVHARIRDVPEGLLPGGATIIRNTTDQQLEMPLKRSQVLMSSRPPSENVPKWFKPTSK